MALIYRNVMRRAFFSCSTRDYCPQSDDLVKFPSDIEAEAAATKKRRDQTVKAFRPSVDPSTTSILLFPGQGAQFVGMGRKLLKNKDALELYAIASDIVQHDMLKLCLEGPIETLNRTVRCQVATLVTSLAALEILRERNPEALESCVASAGFSVGEYAALVFAGALSFEDAVELVHKRSIAMQAASNAVPSALMTVFLSHNSKLNYAMLAGKEYCKQRLGIADPVCSVANFLFPEAKVIGGHGEALDFIHSNREEFGLKRLKMLPVSGAFHTKLMKPAAKEILVNIRSTQFKTPIVPVHSNVTGCAYKHPDAIVEGLYEQVYSPVKWEQLMHTLYQRDKGTTFPRTYEVGPGAQLGAVLRIVNRKAYDTYESVDV